MASTGFAADFVARRADLRPEGSFREEIFAAADFTDFFGFFGREFFSAGFFAACDFAFSKVPILRAI